MKKIFPAPIIILLSTLIASAQTTDLTSQLDRFFRKAEAHGYSGNVLIASKGNVLLRSGYGLQDREKKLKETAETIFDIGSVTKQFTGAAILKLQTINKLDVHDKLSKYFSEIPDDKKEITLLHLLTHSAGFPGAIGDDYDLINADDFMKLAFSTPLDFPPGSEYEYSNVGFSILGILVEKLSGKKYEQFLRDELFAPSGMMHTGYMIPKFNNDQLAVAYRNEERWGTMLEKPWGADGPGWHLKANGGVLTTLDDMHKWYLALKNNTVFNLAEMNVYLSPYIKEFPDGNTYYSFGWVIEPRENGDTLVWHNGGNGAFNTFVGFDLGNDLFMVISSNSNDKIADDYAAVSGKIIMGVFHPLDEMTLVAYPGNYKLESGDIISIRFNELDQLIAGFNSENGLLALSSDGSEEKTKSDYYNARTKEMIVNALNGNFDLLANAWGRPVEVFSQNAGPFWNEMKEQFGKVREVKVLGSVARKRRGIYITFVTVDFERSSKYFTYVWLKEYLDDMREEKNFEKYFEPQGVNSYYAANNNKTISFETNTLVIKSEGSTIKAVKVE